MMGYLNFWFGLVLLTLGVALLCADVWRRTDGKTIRARVAIACIPLAFFAALLPFIFVSAPIDVLMMTLNAGTYVARTETNGITWSSSLAPLKILVRNETSLEYTNVEIYVRTNLHISQAGIANGINRCVAKPTIPGLIIAVPPSLSRTKDGSTKSIPLSENDRDMVSSIYLIQCEKIAPRSRIHIALALVGRDTSHQQLSSRSSPAWAVLSAEYDAAYRRRSQFFSQCFLISCGSYLPKSIDAAVK